MFEINVKKRDGGGGREEGEEGTQLGFGVLIKLHLNH